MTKKFLMLATVAAVALPLSFASASTYGDSNVNNGSMSGSMWANPYVGAFGGYGWTDADTNGGPTLDVNGTDYGLFAGVEIGGLLNSWYNTGITGALEFSYAWSNADETEGGVTVEKNHEWGVSFRPGLAFISDHMPLGLKPYGILGYRRAEFEVTGAGDNSISGFELGIGSELVTYQHFGVRLDYSHVFYQEESGIDPSEDDVRLGLVYHF